MPQDVAVIAELGDGGAVADHTLELLDEAVAQRKVLGGRIATIVPAAEEPADLAPISAHGADVVSLMVDQTFGAHDPRAWVDAVDVACRELHAPLVLIAETPTGCAVAPRLAARLGGTYYARTVRITAEPDGTLSLERAVAGGRVSSTEPVRRASAAVASFRVGSLGVGKPVRGNSATVQRLACPLSEGVRPAELIETIAPDPQTVPIGEARCVVAGGQGFRSKEGMELLWELGRELHMSVGGSKPTVDHGWIPRDRLIGVSSGRRLAPEVFIGVGVSGSSHFVAGMSQSQVVIAVNTNKGAPLMKMADLAIEADLNEVIPALIERVRGTEQTA